MPKINHLKDFQNRPKVRFTFHLPATMSEELAKLATHEGLSVSDVVRRILNDKLRRGK